MNNGEYPFTFEHNGCLVDGKVGLISGMQHPDYEVRVSIDGDLYAYKMILVVPGKLRYSVTWFEPMSLFNRGQADRREAMEGVQRLPANEAFGQAIQYIVAYHKRKVNERGNDQV
jgi:hypothetical protein